MGGQRRVVVTVTCVHRLAARSPSFSSAYRRTVSSSRYRVHKSSATTSDLSAAGSADQAPKTDPGRYRRRPPHRGESNRRQMARSPKQDLPVSVSSACDPSIRRE